MDAENEREREIQHAMNRLYLEAFQGSYQLCEENGKQLIIITYPIKVLFVNVVFPTFAEMLLLLTVCFFSFSFPR